MLCIRPSAKIEYATLELARAADLRVCGTRLERVGQRDALMFDRFDREWNPDANSYWRYGLVSGLTVIDAEDGYLGRERWSYPLLADELLLRKARRYDGSLTRLVRVVQLMSCATSMPLVDVDSSRGEVVAILASNRAHALMVGRGLPGEASPER